MISKAERTELRSVVRQQFKVLRSEVEQRRLELLATVDQQVAERFQEEDEAWRGVMHVAQEAVNEANRRINDALYEAGYEVKGSSERSFIQCYGLTRPTSVASSKQELRHVAASRIAADVKGALLRLDRQEADLLRELAVGALDSEAARAFLANIPTVGELVPAARLNELAAAVDELEA